jgi:hypothetical protein
MATQPDTRAPLQLLKPDGKGYMEAVYEHYVSSGVAMDWRQFIALVEGLALADSRAPDADLQPLFEVRVNKVTCRYLMRPTRVIV